MIKKFYIFSLLHLLVITLLSAQQAKFSGPPSASMKSILQDGSTKDWHTFKKEVAFDKQNPVSFFYEHKEAFELKQGYGIELIKTIEEPDLQMSHYDFQQTYQGKKIIGARYKLHINDKIQRLKGNGLLIKDFLNDQNASVSEQEAWDAAITYMKAPPSELPELELVWYGNYSDRMEDYQLAYQVDVFASPENGKRIFISAINKEVLASQPLVLDVDDLGSAQTLYNGTQNIYTNLIGGFYELIEYSFPGTSTEIETRNMNFQNDFLQSVPYTDIDNNWTDVDDQHGTQVQWGARHAFNYFFTKHDRDSWDNAGKKIKAYADYGTNYGGAFYNIPDATITFGSGNAERGPVGSLDVVAHEFAHGVTMHTAVLIYLEESGALNESFSDIFGTVIEHYVASTDPNTNANWLVGEMTTYNGLGLRSMENPSASPYNDPDTYLGTNWVPAGTWSDNGGVHTNSGVQNHWFYLLSEGGSGVNDNMDTYTVSSITMDAAAAIAYRNLTIYLTDNSQYADARQGSIEAAGDLFGNYSFEQQQVTNAWHAVGVGSPFSTDNVGVNSIRLVGSNPECSTRQVQIDIMNFSTVDVIPENTDIPVSYSVDGLNPVNAIVTLPIGTNLMPGETFSYTFSQLPVFTQPNSVLTATTSYPLDLFTDNDGQSVTVRLSGVYTVGGVNPDYITLQNAIDDLSSGSGIFCGPVSLQIRPGIYSESVVIGDIPGTTVDSPLIIESETGNKADVTLTSSGLSTIMLEDTKHLVLRDLTIQNTTSNIDGGIILMKNSSENITIENNTIVSTPGTTDNNNLIAALYEGNPLMPSTFQNDGLYIYNNELLNGANAIYLKKVGFGHGLDERIIFSDVEIANNSIQNFNKRGMDIHDVENAVIRNNILSSDNAERGIAIYQFQSSGGNFSIEKNQISIRSFANRGISFRGNNLVTPTVSIINNFIDLKALPGGCEGIEIFIANGNVFHNTVRIVPDVIELNISKTFSASFTSLQVQNNIFYNTCTNAIGIRNWQIGVSTFDYNNLYIPNGVTGEVDGVDIANLMDWQTAGHGQNSLDIDPQFVSVNDLHLINTSALIRAGIYHSEAADDIDGELRFDPPTMGADEVILTDYAELIDITISGFCLGIPQTVSITVNNEGNNQITSMTIDWMVNGISQTSNNWSGNIAIGGSETIAIGNALLSPGINIVTATIATSNSANNSQTFQFNSSLSGNYSVGAGADFVSFDEAVNALQTNGTCGPVIFNIVPGTYNEPVTINNIPGTSSVNTVTFRSASGNAEDVALSHLELNGALNIWFENITFSSDDPTATLVAVNTGSSNIRFEQNIFSDGNLAIAVNQSDNIMVLDNTFDGQITGAISITSGVSPFVSSNTITSNSINTNYTAIQCQDCSLGMVIENSSIDINTGRGIAMSNFVAYQRDPGLIANNMIVIRQDNDTNSSGMELNNLANLHVYYNSVSLLESEIFRYPPEGSAALRIVGTNTSTWVYNNILNNDGGTAYEVSTIAGITSNFNDVLVGHERIPLGIVQSSTPPEQPLLNDWQYETSMDANSLSVDPVFVSATDLHIQYKFTPLREAGTYLSNVTYDIDGDARPIIISPSIGADQPIKVNSPLARIGSGQSEQEEKTDIVETGFSDDLKFYPNPVADFMHIVVSGEGEYTILDLSGKVLKHLKFEKGPLELDVRDLLPGIYAISIKEGERLYNQKFIKE